VSSALAQGFAFVSGVTLRLIDSVAALTRSAGSLSLPSPTLAVCLTLFLAFAFLSDYFLGQRKHKQTMVALLLALSLFLYKAPSFFAPRTGITILAVRNGVAVHVRTDEKDTLYGTYRGIHSFETQGYLQCHNIPASNAVIIDTKEFSMMLNSQEITVGEGYLRIGERTYFSSSNGQMRVHIQNGIPIVQAYAKN
jgi:hypothetical protein